MWLFLLGLGLQLAGGLAALFDSRRGASPHFWGASGAVTGSLVALAGVASAVLNRAPSTLALPWSVPMGSLALAIDSVSAWFLVPFAIVGCASALYGVSYLNHGHGRAKLGSHWFFFNALLVAMNLVLTAQNAVLFLMAWEAMTVTSFVLVTFEHDREEVRSAGWLYLVASHLGAAFLMGLFLLLGREAGSFDFAALAQSSPSTGLAAVAFFMALVGFGLKAGIVPVHVWLPEAHPAAPSHVSALMSGVMIKTGVYGLVRTLGWLGPVQAWWGWTLVGIGLVSALVGVVFALAQQDIKRLLAYSSVENAGIIALGLGLGVVGLATHQPLVAGAGFAGALLHVLNHSMFKSLLFFGAGALIHETGTRSLEQLGGLMKQMPRTGAAFLLGSLAIVGLPPLNGFVSEFLLYAGMLQGASSSGMEPAAGFALCAAGLALVGGLAVACFTKAFGSAFLGVARKPLNQHITDPGKFMQVAMLLPAAGCVVIGLGSPLALQALENVVSSMPGAQSANTRALQNALGYVTLTAAIVLAVVAGLWTLRTSMLRKRPVRLGPTWDCGYALPTSRMQYTGSSFSEPLLQTLHVLLRTSRAVQMSQELYPKAGSLSTHVVDPWKDRVFAGLFRKAAALLDRFHWIQQGKVQLYVLYVLVTLVALLLWKLS